MAKAKEPSFEAMLQKQRDIELLMRQVEGETDGGKIAGIAEVLVGEVADLEAMAAAMKTEFDIKPNVGHAEVVLTADQRARVKEKTGIPMNSVFLPDESGILARMMKNTQPPMIEVRATAEAEKLSKAADAQTQVDQLLAEVMPQLEALIPDAHPEYKEQLDEVKTKMKNKK